MALFTDGPINTLRDLERYESALLTETSVEQINVNAKMALAQDLIASELLIFLIKHSTRDANTLFADGALIRRKTGLHDVVITAPLQRWHAFKTIELTYQEAYNNQLNDRYRGRYLQYQQRAIEAARQLYQIGVGLVWQPIPKPMTPLLLSITGNALSTDYYVRTTWANSAGQESAPSELVALQIPDGAQLVVEQPGMAANTAGWNVYVGSTPEEVTLQNDIPVPAGSTWQLASGSDLRLGRPLGPGQWADRFIVDQQSMLRG
jgi:prepilin-type processing-associated H-X9-DG protein